MPGISGDTLAINLVSRQGILVTAGIAVDPITIDWLPELTLLRVRGEDICQNQPLSISSCALVWSWVREKASGESRPGSSTENGGSAGSLPIRDNHHALQIAVGIGVEQCSQCQPTGVEIAHFAQVVKAESLNF